MHADELQAQCPVRSTCVREPIAHLTALGRLKTDSIQTETDKNRRKQKKIDRIQTKAVKTYKSR